MALPVSKQIELIRVDALNGCAICPMRKSISAVCAYNNRSIFGLSDKPDWCPIVVLSEDVLKALIGQLEWILGNSGDRIVSYEAEEQALKTLKGLLTDEK